MDNRISYIKRLCKRHNIKIVWKNESTSIFNFKDRFIFISRPDTDEEFISILKKIGFFAVGDKKSGFEREFDIRKYSIIRGEENGISPHVLQKHIEDSIKSLKEILEKNYCSVICPRVAEIAFRLKSVDCLESFKRFLTKKSSVFPRWKVLSTEQIKSILSISIKKNKEILKRIEYIEKLCTKNNTIIEGWVDNYKGGVAHIYKKTILIPIPKNDEDFLVCLHEISHCVRGRMKTKFDEEVHAEIDAIQWGRDYGISKKSILSYKKSAKENIEEYRIKENIDKEKYRYVYSIMNNQIKLILNNKKLI
jgi:hypothetical protein